MTWTMLMADLSLIVIVVLSIFVAATIVFLIEGVRSGEFRRAWARAALKAEAEEKKRREAETAKIYARRREIDLLTERTEKRLGRYLSIAEREELEQTFLGRLAIAIDNGRGWLPRVLMRLLDDREA